MNDESSEAVGDNSEERIQRYLHENEYIGEFRLGNEYIIKKHSICCMDFAYDLNFKANGYLKALIKTLYM